MTAVLFHRLAEIEQCGLCSLQPARSLGEHAAAAIEDDDEVTARRRRLGLIAAPLRPSRAQHKRNQSQRQTQAAPDGQPWRRVHQPTAD